MLKNERDFTRWQEMVLLLVVVVAVLLLLQKSKCSDADVVFEVEFKQPHEVKSEKVQLFCPWFLEEWGVSCMLLPGNEGRDLGMKGKKNGLLLFPQTAAHP